MRWPQKALLGPSSGWWHSKATSPLERYERLKLIAVVWGNTAAVLPTPSQYVALFTDRTSEVEKDLCQTNINDQSSGVDVATDVARTFPLLFALTRGNPCEGQSCYTEKG
jgi:hypothetical protein